MRILLMAGGAGTRLWPLSTEERPKQFLPLLTEKSLLAETYARVLPISRDVFVATAQRHARLVREDLPSLKPRQILAEPARRNSGPALLSAALQFEQDGDPITAAIPSDQTVADDDAFRRAIAAGERAAESASVVVFAVPPTRPETDYGYLELREDTAEDGLEVVRFIEKPSVAQAEEHLQAGFFWNAGIFVFRPSRLLAEARRVAGELLEGVERYRRALAAGDSESARQAYESLPAISIDYAVMEKAARVRAVRLRAGWSDVGTWRSVRDLRGPSDDRQNLIVSATRVLAPGVRDTAIVLSEEGLLVLPFDRENELRGAVDKMRAKRASSKPLARGSKPGRKTR
jgi:mannose-1-phosphate guanylyltransferase/mannose-6-phosphate isomerase